MQTLLARGDIAGAEAEMEKTDWAVDMPGTFPIARAVQASFRVWYAVRGGDLKAAREWGNRMHELFDILPPYYQPPWARLLIAEGDRLSAMAFLQSLYTRAAQAEAYGLMIGILVYQALAADTSERALGFLTEALTLGETRGYIRTFVDEGKSLKPLLKKALECGVALEYTRNLLDIIETEEAQLKAKNEEAVTPGPLSDREIEIVRLIAAGLSNRQIADRLIISIGTAKTHVHNLLEKLEAKTRTGAVARARELKLI